MQNQKHIRIWREIETEINTKWTKFLKTNSYLRSDKKHQLILSLNQAIKKLRTPWHKCLSINIQKELREKRRKLHKNANLIEKYNEKYVLREIKNNLNFFEGKEDSLPYPLDKNQRQAIVRDDKHNLVIAAAGSGKTSVLTARIAYLIRKRKVSSKKILALAFTKAAAGEMEERMKKLFGISIRFATFHSLGLSILSKYGDKDCNLLCEENLTNYLENIFILLLQDSSFISDLVNYLNHIDSNNHIDTKIKVLILENKKFHVWVKERKQKADRMIRDFEEIKIDLYDLLGILYEMKGDIKEICSQVGTFIKLAKSNFLSVKNIKNRLRRNKYTETQKSFGKIAVRIYEKYQEQLTSSKQIDFNDMINKAIKVVQNNLEKFRGKYSHILVDEFQDISNQRAKLIKCFVNKNSKTKLFCVGDDYQSIYRFAGSEIDFFVNFHRFFPRPTKTFLSTNYRCARKIIEASNKVIKNNKKQVKKTVVPFSKSKGDIFLYEMKDTSRYARKLQNRYVFNKVKTLLQEGIDKEEIMIISRFNHTLNELREKLKKSRIKVVNDNASGIRLTTAHSAKGLEAEHVFLLSLTKGKYGFPCEVKDPQVLDIAKNRKVEGKLDEERRLFYVALTRAKKCLYLFTQKDKNSQFLKEMEKFIDKKMII